MSDDSNNEANRVGVLFVLSVENEMDCFKCGRPVEQSYEQATGTKGQFFHSDSHYGVTMGMCVLKRELFVGCLKRVGDNLWRIIKLPFQSF